MYYANIDSQDKLVCIGLCPMAADEYGSEDVKNIEVSEEVYNNAQEYGTNYYIYSGGEIVLNPDYETEQAEKEAERVGHLKCTKRVFILMLEQLGYDYYEQILPLIEANRQAKLEWDLCVELERNNPLIDILAAQVGVTSEQIDNLFKYANGEITLEQFREV